MHTKDVIAVFPDFQKPHIIHSASIDKSVNSYDLKTDKKVIFHQAKNGMILSMSQRKDHEQELGNIRIKWTMHLPHSIVSKLNLQLINTTFSFLNIIQWLADWTFQSKNGTAMFKNQLILLITLTDSTLLKSLLPANTWLSAQTLEK